MIIGPGEGVWDKTLPKEFNSLKELVKGNAYFVNLDRNVSSIWITNV